MDEKRKRTMDDMVDFFYSLGVSPEVEALSPKARAARANVMSWPGHIPRGPIFALASAMIGEDIPDGVKGFVPFSIRICTKGYMVDRFGKDKAVMCLPKYGDNAQSGVTADNIKKNSVGKWAVQWDEGQSRPATREEIRKFLKTAFSI